MDDEIEKIAVNTVTQALQAEGWSVQSVESENRGFDLIARWDMPRELEGAEAYPPAAIRFIEVKGRSQVGTVGLTRNEYQTAQRLKGDYWLYVVYNCATQPEVHAIQDPAKLDWEPVRIIEHYQIGSKDVVGAEI